MFNIINKSELIAKDIEFQISQKKYVNSIPSERKLAEQYSVSRNTIREALDILLNKCVISLNSNSYEINSPKEDYDWLDIFGKQSVCKVHNSIVKNTCLEVNKKIAQKLKVPLATKIRLLVYKRTIIENNSSRVLSLDYVYVPEKLAKSVDLKKLNNSSFWQLLLQEKKGKNLKEYQNLSIDVITDEEAAILELPTHSKVLERTSLFYIEDTHIYFISKKIPENSLLMQIDR
ncbi:hypothetical protein DKL56_01365 [Lactobacillus apis]|uniref:GntR family transcriptional regulator n=1 Tax=Lactobacillus apis TaxID=303541 RepID=UPI000D6A8CC2|nr:GntR family transcriptional regulator [Lactobacillus apis]AWM73250.1 hypothetical protein DKL56_01365 [Lactobacillus apis]